MRLVRAVGGAGLFAATVVISVAALGAQGFPTASIQGVVTDPDGAALPGVTIKVEGERGRRQTFSGPEGAYAIYGLVPGDYNLVGKLDGFCTHRDPEILVRSRAATYVNFSMGLAPVEYHAGGGVRLSTQEALEYADAVVHLRISKGYELQPWSGDTVCGVAGVEHEAFVLGTVKRHALHGPAPVSCGQVVRW